MYLLIKLKEWLYSINIKNSVHHIHEINRDNPMMFNQRVVGFLVVKLM